MVDPDEIAELVAQQKHDRKVERNNMLDPRDPDYEYHDEEPE